MDVVLFLNKKDVLRKKILQTPFSSCFRDWPSQKDPHSYDDAVAFLGAKVVLRKESVC